jgi:hypothetical protein
MEVDGMAGSFSNHLEDELLDHVFGNGSYTPPDTYIALYTVAPTDAGGGTEVSGGSYARVEVTSWDASSGGATANTGVVTFTTATDDWGTIVAYGIYDAASAGNLLAWADLDAEKACPSGDTWTFPAGNIDITLD